MSASGCLVYHEAARFLIIVNFMFTGSNIRHTAMVCEVSVLLNNALKTSTQILSRLVHKKPYACQNIYHLLNKSPAKLSFITTALELMAVQVLC